MNEPLTAKLRQFVHILDVVRVEEHITRAPLNPLGRTPLDRRAIARAFLAKALYDLPTTDLLIELLKLQPILRKLCGFERRQDVPSAATFSRAFAEFAASALADRLHAAGVAAHVKDTVVQHISRDSTAVEAREKPTRKEKAPKVPRKRGRPAKGEVREVPEERRLARQEKQTAQQALSELPKVCDVGGKRDSKGNPHYWVGWKCHIDWADDGVPLNVVTTSASVHDSQVAIPMMRVTAERVTSLYDLMDSAYDAPEIHEVSRSLGHVPIIDPNKRRAEAIELDPAKKHRFYERSTAERGNSRSKDGFGFRHLRVRGHAKAHLHLMFGILSLFADRVCRPVRPAPT